MPRRKIETNSPQAVCGRIRALREARGLEQKALAARLGVSANAVSNWECGRSRPDLNLLPALCGALGTTPGELLGMEAPAGALSPAERRLLEGCRALNTGHRAAVDRLIASLLEAQAAPDGQDSRSAEDLRPIRKLIYFERPLAAGVGDPTEFDDAGTPVWVYATPETERAGCVFSVNGESMEPAFKSGDRVLVSRIPDAPALQYGEIGAFIAGNETYIKVYEKDGLHSLNPAFPTLTFDESTPVFLIGRVMGRLDPRHVVPAAEAERRLALQE